MLTIFFTENVIEEMDIKDSVALSSNTLSKVRTFTCQVKILTLAREKLF